MVILKKKLYKNIYYQKGKKKKIWNVIFSSYLVVLAIITTNFNYKTKAN